MLNESIEISDDIPMFEQVSKKKINFEESIELTGGFGQFQKYVSAILVLTFMTGG